MSDLVISGGGVVNLIGADFDTLSVTGTSLNVTDSDDITLGEISVVDTLTVSAGGDITDANGSTIDVGGSASFTGANIALGDDAADQLQFDSLQFRASGDVTISESGSMRLIGSNTADTATLHASGDINLDADAAIHSEGGRVSLQAGTEGSLSVSVRSTCHHRRQQGAPLTCLVNVLGYSKTPISVLPEKWVAGRFSLGEIFREAMKTFPIQS